MGAILNMALAVEIQQEPQGSRCAAIHEIARCSRFWLSVASGMLFVLVARNPDSQQLLKDRHALPVELCQASLAEARTEAEALRHHSEEAQAIH